MSIVLSPYFTIAVCSSTFPHTAGSLRYIDPAFRAQSALPVTSSVHRRFSSSSTLLRFCTDFLDNLDQSITILEYSDFSNFFSIRHDVLLLFLLCLETVASWQMSQKLQHYQCQTVHPRWQHLQHRCLVHCRNVEKNIPTCSHLSVMPARITRLCLTMSSNSEELAHPQDMRQEAR